MPNRCLWGGATFSSAHESRNGGRSYLIGSSWPPYFHFWVAQGSPFGTPWGAVLDHFSSFLEALFWGRLQEVIFEDFGAIFDPFWELFLIMLWSSFRTCEISNPHIIYYVWSMYGTWQNRVFLPHLASFFRAPSEDGFLIENLTILASIWGRFWEPEASQAEPRMGPETRTSL